MRPPSIKPVIASKTGLETDRLGKMADDLSFDKQEATQVQQMIQEQHRSCRGYGFVKENKQLPTQCLAYCRHYQQGPEAKRLSGSFIFCRKCKILQAMVNVAGEKKKKLI